MTQTYRSATQQNGRQDTILNQTTDWTGSPSSHRNHHQPERSWTADGDNIPDEPQMSPEMPLRPNRRVNSIVEMGVPLGNASASGTNTDLSRVSSGRRVVHHMLRDFRSPIGKNSLYTPIVWPPVLIVTLFLSPCMLDVASGSGRRNNLEFNNNGSRLTFTR